MAKYRAISKVFINGIVYAPEGGYPSELEVPDDFIPNYSLEPLDAPAKAAMAKYEKAKSAVTKTTTEESGEVRRTANPVENLPVRETPKAPAPPAKGA